jgi:hypothetical protein
MSAKLSGTQADKINRMCPMGKEFSIGTKISEMEGVSSPGTIRYIDGTNGADTNDGLTWASAYKTIQAAVTAASAGDTLLMIGTFTEQVTCSKQLSFIGAGKTVNDCVWMEVAAGNTLLTLTGKGCLIQNIRFRIPTTGGIGINMAASDYTIIQGCHFQGRAGSYYAIYNNGGSQCQILDNVFEYMNTATYGTAILGYTYTAFPAGWIIARNIFHSNLKHISMIMRQSQIVDNIFQTLGLAADNTSALTATTQIDLSGTGGQLNYITRNSFGVTCSHANGFVESASNDNWKGNYAAGALNTATPS